MAEPVQTPAPANPGATEGSGAAPKLAPHANANPPTSGPARPHARVSALAHGGNPTGRPSKFSAPAGTAKGDAERKAADKQRKRNERAEESKREEQQPVLTVPGAVPVGPVPTPGPGQPVAMPGQGVPPVPWTPEKIDKLVAEIIDAIEEFGVESFVSQAREAKLPESLVREIEQSSKFPQLSKLTLKERVPVLICKWFNKFGVSAEHSDELICAVALVRIVLHQKATYNKLHELIEEAKKAVPKQPEKKQ